MPAGEEEVEELSTVCMCVCSVSVYMRLLCVCRDLGDPVSRL